MPATIRHQEVVASECDTAPQSQKAPILTHSTATILSTPAQTAAGPCLPFAIFTTASNSLGLLVPMKWHELAC